MAWIFINFLIFICLCACRCIFVGPDESRGMCAHVEARGQQWVWFSGTVYLIIIVVVIIIIIKYRPGACQLDYTG